MGVLCACMSVPGTYVPGAHGGQERGLDSVELQFQTVVSPCMCSGGFSATAAGTLRPHLPVVQWFTASVHVSQASLVGKDTLFWLVILSLAITIFTMLYCLYSPMYQKNVSFLLESHGAMILSHPRSALLTPFLPSSLPLGRWRLSAPG